MRKETKTRRTRKQTDRQRSGITFLSYSVSFQAPFHKNILKKRRRKGGKILRRSTSPVFCSCLSLPPSARVTEYYSVSFRERKGGTRLKEKGGVGWARVQNRYGQTLCKLCEGFWGGCDRHIKPPILATSPSSPTYNKMQDRPALGAQHEGSHHHHWG